MPRILRGLLKLLAILLLVAGIAYTVALIMVLVVSQQDQRRPADAIVVLGAAQYNGRPSPVLKARLDHAADLYRDRLGAPDHRHHGSKVAARPEIDSRSPPSSTAPA